VGPAIRTEQLARLNGDDVATMISEVATRAGGQTTEAGRRYVKIATTELVAEGEIGSGGFGSVRRVLDRTLDRHLAMKLLSPRLSTKTRHVERFVREAQIMAQLDHPNVVPVHDLSTDEDGPYFTMKLVEGHTLYERVCTAPGGSADPDALGFFLDVFLKVCDAVAFAHSRGICHCDIKPENIMVGTYGRVYLMDWGIASTIGAIRREPEDPPSESGARPRRPIRGTPAYMAPEQAAGRPDLIDGRTDVFGLGGVLYFILTGLPPFPGTATAQSMLHARQQGPVAMERLTLAPTGLQTIIKKAMSLRPAERHATVLELRAEVEAVLRGAWHLPTRRYAPGALIIAEGDEGDSAFVLLSGHCVVSKGFARRRRVIRRLRPGDVFGETALLAGTRRTATVEAADEVLVRVVTWESLRSQLGVGTDLGRFVMALADRFCQMDDKLSEIEAAMSKRRERSRSRARKRATKGARV
jgi:serine/threonine-protein kinase